MDHYGVLVMLTARDWVLQGSYRFPRRLPSSSPGPLSEKMGGALPFLRKRKVLGTIKCKRRPEIRIALAGLGLFYLRATTNV